MQQTIEASIRTHQHRNEVFEMGKTIAQDLEERGMKRGMERGMERGELRARQTTLIRQLRKRFRDLSAELVQTIEATEDIAQLDEWLDRVVTAKSLREVGIGSAT